MSAGGQIHRSDSELSSCCLSDVDSTTSSSAVSSTTTTENGFDTDHHEGGTIRRKPVGATTTLISALTSSTNDALPPPSPSVLPAPPTSMLLHDVHQRQLGDVPKQFTESDLSLNSLPPPPEELRHLQRIHSIAHSGVTTCEHHVQQSPLLDQQQTQSGILVNGGHPQQQHQLQQQVLINGSQQMIQASVINSIQQQQQQQVQQSIINGMKQQQNGLAANGIIQQQQSMIINGMQQQQLTVGYQPQNLAGNHYPQQPPNLNNGSLGLQPQPPLMQTSGPNQGMLQQQPQQLIREEIYPCGVPRAVFQPGSVEPSQNQMDLLKMLPNNPPPRPFAMIVSQPALPDLKSSLKPSPPSAAPPSSTSSSSATATRRRRITFNELVHSVDDDDETEYHQLKGDDVTPTAEDVTDNYSERDVSNWVLESLKHCRVNDGPVSNGTAASNGVAIPPVTLPIIAHELRPKIYNGRSVPNCFPPSGDEVTRPSLNGLSPPPSVVLGVDPRRKVGPPPPPKRSQNTQLTSPT